MEKICQGIIVFVNTEIKKRKLHDPKNLILLGDIDIDIILISSMVCPDEKMQIVKIHHFEA